MMMKKKELLEFILDWTRIFKWETRFNIEFSLVSNVHPCTCINFKQIYANSCTVDLLWFTPILFFWTYLFFFCDYSSFPCHRPADLTCLHNRFLPSTSSDFYDSFLITRMYVDDLLIASPNPKTHVEWTCHVLKHMMELNLHLKLKKCQFNIPEVGYLRMIVKPSQLAMDPVKLDGIAAWPTPAKVKDVRSFLSFANFYCQFIPNYSTIAHPLLNLTKKDNHWDWTPTCQQSFNKLKKLFLPHPVLHLPDFSKPFAITTNASKYASGAILLQTNFNSNWHPCSYLFQLFISTEQNYNIYIWLRTPCHHPHPEILETLPPWIPLSHPGLHRSQKLDVLPPSPES